MHTRPLFAGEQRHWARLQVVADPSELNLLQVYRFTGSPDALSFGTRMRQVLDRHSTLRTAYRLDQDGGQVAEIHDCGAVRSRLIELDATDEDDALQLVERLRTERFDLGVPPLLRLIAVRLPANEFWIVLIVHHIVAEADSLRIVWRDLLGFTAPGPPTGARRSYEEFVTEELRYADSPEYAADAAYWREKADEIESGILPASVPVAPVGDDEVRSIPIDRDQWSELLSFTRTAAVTPFAAVLACVGRALHRLSGRHLVTVGVSVSTRPMDGYEEVVGNFTNILPVVLRPATGSLHQLAAATMDAVLDAFEHARAPAQEIVAAERGWDRSARYALTVTATTYVHHDSFVTPGAGTAHAVAVHRGTSKVGLSVYLAIHSDSAVIHVVRGAQRQVVGIDPLADEVTDQIACLIQEGRTRVKNDTESRGR